MNASYSSPNSFFSFPQDASTVPGQSTDMDEANKMLTEAVNNPVFDKMDDKEITGYMIAGFITAFILLFMVTYALAFGIATITILLGLPLIVQFILSMIPSILSIIYVEKVVRYFVTPVVAKSMVFYAKAVTKIKSYFNKK